MEIVLPKGMAVKIDEIDFDWLSAYRWCDLRRRYVIGWVDGTKQLMHRVIMTKIVGHPLLRSEIIDHVDGDGFDCRRFNLRLCTQRQNLQNMRNLRGGSSQYKGVCWNKASKKWQSNCRFDGAKHTLGSFDNEIDAALCYDAAAREHFGEFAYTNF